MSASLPAATGERQQSLDVLRGFALLGILVMNVQGFAMIAAAYANPTAYGDLGGLNLLVWLLGHVFAEQKFLGLFAMLFGAGIVLNAAAAERRGEEPFALHRRRMGWLMVFGLLHGYLFWYGDILFSYGLCGLLVFALWRQSPGRLFVLAALSLLVPAAVLIVEGYFFGPLPPDAVLPYWQPGPEAIAAEVAAYQGGWREQMRERAPLMTLMIVSLPLDGAWRIIGMMLLGMGLYKLGALSAGWPAADYRRLLWGGLALGLPLILLGVLRNFQHAWAPGYSVYFGSLYNYGGSIAVALAYVGGVMLVCQRLWLPRLRRALAAVGQLALSNYLLQTLICTSVFYGHGLGLFGQVTRSGQLALVFVVWALQIAWSLVWLRRFRYGPAEWLWRSLSHRRRQPLRR